MIAQWQQPIRDTLWQLLTYHLENCKLHASWTWKVINVEGSGESTYSVQGKLCQQFFSTKDMFRSLHDNRIIQSYLTTQENQFKIHVNRSEKYRRNLNKVHGKEVQQFRQLTISLVRRQVWTQAIHLTGVYMHIHTPCSYYNICPDSLCVHSALRLCCNRWCVRTATMGLFEWWNEQLNLLAGYGVVLQVLTKLDRNTHNCSISTWNHFKSSE